MISCTVSGNLTSDVAVAFESKNAQFGKTYKVRLASNKSVYKDGQYVDEVTYVSGLMSEKRLGKALPFLTKGKGVVCASSSCSVSSYMDKAGQPKASLELGYIDRIEFTGGKKSEGVTQNTKTSNQQNMEAKAPQDLEFPL